MEAKKKAAVKIYRWWKGKKIQRLKAGQRPGNYLELAADPICAKHIKNPDLVKDLRIIQAVHSDRDILQDLNFLIRAESVKDELLSFLLTKSINSSLDFHFILMTLNKIDDCRKQYFEYCSWDEEEIHEYDLSEIKEDLNEMIKTITVWKSDEKWMRDKNISFKKKKVFEVKWMRKNLHLGNIIKKRAGLKKQDVLQKKKAMLKRINK